MSLFDRIVVGAMPLVPRVVVERVASRYVAGESLTAAIETVRKLNGESTMATLDVLGEEVTDDAQAAVTVDEYCEALQTIRDEGLDSNVSVKLTALGLHADEERCTEQLARIVDVAAQVGSFVRMDMEDHTCTDATLGIYRKLRERYENVGVVLQAMLHRTPQDIRELLPLSPNVRLCKGIYREPAEIAHQHPSDVRQAYVECMNLLLEGGAYVGLATHDEVLIEAALQSLERLTLPREGYEFQMLLGVLPSLRRRLIAARHRLRVYVPYGADWYAYSMRRLRENPTVAKHVMLAFFKR
ncbi:MAG: proline dehydrogenase [Proteobacteria bacterium]|nr:MAG: proline dehydrogenase [Pseudomonadota bacterium]